MTPIRVRIAGRLLAAFFMLAVAACAALQEREAPPAQAAGQAQQIGPCGPRKALVAYLATHYGQRLVASGLDRDGFLMEIFAHPEGRYTVVIAAPDGRACAWLSGLGWRVYVAPGGAVADFTFRLED